MTQVHGRMQDVQAEVHFSPWDRHSYSDDTHHAVPVPGLGSEASHASKVLELKQLWESQGGIQHETKGVISEIPESLSEKRQKCAHWKYNSMLDRMVKENGTSGRVNHTLATSESSTEFDPPAYEDVVTSIVSNPARRICSTTQEGVESCQQPDDLSPMNSEVEFHITETCQGVAAQVDNLRNQKGTKGLVSGSVLEEKTPINTSSPLQHCSTQCEVTPEEIHTTETADPNQQTSRFDDATSEVLESYLYVLQSPNVKKSCSDSHLELGVTAVSKPNRFTVVSIGKDPLHKEHASISSRGLTESAPSVSIELGRIPSTVSSIKVDSTCSILDEVFYTQPTSKASDEDSTTVSISEPAVEEAHQDEVVTMQQPLTEATSAVDRLPLPLPLRGMFKNRGKTASNLTLVPKPEDYVLLSCLVTFCCNPLFGIFALTFAFLSNSSFEKGHVSQAKANSRRALILSILGVVTTAATVLTLLIVYWPSDRAEDPVQ